MEKVYNTKEKIIQVTLELIKKEMEVKKITIRDIAKKAQIAKGMINYYFDSKDKLIDEAVQAFINEVIGNSDNTFNNIDLSPKEILIKRVQSAAKFLAENPGISKISILRDLKNGKEDDNSSRVVQAYYKHLQEIFGDERDDVQLKIMSQQIVAAVQQISLRASLVEKQTGIDFYDEEQRDKLVEHIIENIIN